MGEPLNKLGYHVALRAADGELFAGVEAAVRSLRRSGALDAIQLRWEGPGE